MNPQPLAALHGGSYGLIAVAPAIIASHAKRLDHWRNRLHTTMDWKIFITIFGVVFMAELGDKTQLATMLFAADKEANKYMVFVAASLALVVASGLGVLVGSVLSEYINQKYLHYIAGVGFMAIGAVTLYTA